MKYLELSFSDEEPLKPSHSSGKKDQQQIGKVKDLEHPFSDEEPLKPRQYDKGKAGKVQSQGKHSHLRRTHLSLLKPHDERGIKHLSSTQDIDWKSHQLVVRVNKIMETKAMLHFIWSYHLKLRECVSVYEFEESFYMLDGWLEDLFEYGAPPYARTSLPTSLHLGAYMPQRWVFMLRWCLEERDLFDVDLRRREEDQLGRVFHVVQMPSWAIRSAIRQASESILKENTRQIAISGQEAGEVAKALKDMPEIQSRFDVVLYIYVSQHPSIEQIDELIQANTLSLSLEEDKTYRILLILDCSGAYYFQQQTLRTLMARDYACLVIVTHSDNIYQTAGVDVGINMEDHLLPLELFWEHAAHNRDNISFSAYDRLAMDIVDLCGGDLVAVVLLANELRLHSMDAWEAALDELKSKGVSIMLHVLTFIWNRKDAITKLCLQWVAATHSSEEDLTRSSMVSSWLTEGYVQTEAEGVKFFNQLIDSALLEQHGNSEKITIWKEIQDFLFASMVTPSQDIKVTDWQIPDDAEIINLTKSELSELPDSPICPRVFLLCIQNNRNIMIIPPLFFQHMPMLSTLNMSHTSIKTLPASISALISLRRLFLRGCELFLELPPEIGQLSDLEVIDLEGTRVTHLPDEIAQLHKLQLLKLSFYACGKDRQGSKQRISEGIFSQLRRLEVICIDVDSDADEDEWTADIQNVLLDLSKESSYINLSNIVLYVPDTKLLEHVPLGWGTEYKLVVGRCGQRMISRIPSVVEEKCKQQTRLLKYVNGEHIPAEIMNILSYSNAFILDRHWTAKSLSEFADEKFYSLTFCLLVECNELETVSEEGCDRFECIEYLYIHYMKNLRSIWSGQVSTTSYLFFKLKYLNLCTCMILESVVSLSWLGELRLLEELVVEDCPKIESLVSQDRDSVHQDGCFLPNLKNMSLRELPELVSISNGLKMAPNLEKLVIFYCPKLESISEVLGENLKVVKGETEWWDSLSWKETDKLGNKFVPLQRDGDLMAQFTQD